MDINLVAELIAFAILMLFSGFFSSSETSLFSLNSLQIEQMRRDDNPRIGLIEKMLSEPRRLIVTILIGNEFVNVAASVISAAMVIQLMGADSKLVNLFIMVPILLLVGEITPKTLAIRHNVAFATWQCRPIDLFARLITPLRWIIRLVADGFTTLIIGSERTRASIITRDMVRTLAQEAVGDGVLDQNEAKYIEQIFDFGNRTVADLMTPRSNVFFLSMDTPVAEIIAEIKRTKRTKIPLHRGRRDDIVGVLHARDLLRMDIGELLSEPGKLLDVVREPYFVAESKSASDLFHAFRKRRASVALAVDEYGGVTGLVTMEDLLECIFGDIPSPSDQTEETALQRHADGTVLIDGGLSIGQFNEIMGTRLDAGEFDTIGGLLLHEFGELPQPDSRIELAGQSFCVREVESNRIKALDVRSLMPLAESDELADAAVDD